jgi:uncharacterized protein (DUF983 family)
MGIIFSFTATKKMSFYTKSSLSTTSNVINMVIKIWSCSCIFLRKIIILSLMRLQKLKWLLFLLRYRYKN